VRLAEPGRNYVIKLTIYLLQIQASQAQIRSTIVSVTISARKCQVDQRNWSGTYIQQLLIPENADFVKF
jgi:hypothetical protein